jgi:hypothetical protein
MISRGKAVPHGFKLWDTALPREGDVIDGDDGIGGIFGIMGIMVMFGMP